MADQPSPRNAILIAIAFVVLLGVIAGLGAARLGLVRPFWSRPPVARPPATVRQPAQLYFAFELTTTWANGAPLRLEDLKQHPTLVVIWSDTYPEGIAALARAEEIRDAYERFGLR